MPPRPLGFGSSPSGLGALLLFFWAQGCGLRPSVLELSSLGVRGGRHSCGPHGSASTLFRGSLPLFRVLAWWPLRWRKWRLGFYLGLGLLVFCFPCVLFSLLVLD